MKHPSYCCQKCGELIGWLGRIMPFHKCEEKKTILALRYKLAQPERQWVGLEQSDMPDGKDPMFDHQYFLAGMVFAAKVLQEKNT